MYKVIKSFSDLQDSGFVYRAGDTFPRFGKEVTKERIDELASKSNKREEVLIQYIEDAEPKITAPAEKKRKRKNAGTDPKVN